MSEQINKVDIEKYYRFLNHQEETEIRVCDPDKIKLPISIFCKNLSEFKDACEKYNGIWNIYAGINERTSKGKSDEDVKYITCIGHDLDCHNDTGNLDVAKETALKIKEDSIKLGYEEPLIICSGRGYWVLHRIEPIESTPENEERIKIFASKIRRIYEKEGVSFDSKVYNPSRIARVSGTMNVSDKNNFCLSYCLNNPSGNPDFNLTQDILSIEPPKYKDFVSADIPKGECAFMDYCLKNSLPIGERHSIISRNLSLYIYNRPDREKLKEVYISVQNGKSNELDNWLKSIEKNPNKKFPFSCGELVNYQKRYNIPFQCKECNLFLDYIQEHEYKYEPRGWARSINIKTMAQRYGLLKCPFCNNEFKFNEKFGLFICETCKINSSLKIFSKLCYAKKLNLVMKKEFLIQK